MALKAAFLDYGYLQAEVSREAGFAGHTGNEYQQLQLGTVRPLIANCTQSRNLETLRVWDRMVRPSTSALSVIQSAFPITLLSGVGAG